MLYLAEVKKSKKSLFGNAQNELLLLAQQVKSNYWIPAQSQTISAEAAKDWADGALVIVELGTNQNIRGNIEPAAQKLVSILRNFSTVLVKYKEQEKQIEQWKQSLTYQFEELESRKYEIEIRMKQLKEMEQQLKLLEKQSEKLNSGNKTIQNNNSRPLIGTILQQADLVSEAQIELVLNNQSQYPDLKIGELLCLRGWIKPETTDFFVQQWYSILQQPPNQPLGYYLQQASLLSKEQINILLAEQKQLKLRLGAIAVLKGWIKQSTLDFFIKHLFPQRYNDSPWNNEHNLTIAS